MNYFRNFATQKSRNRMKFFSKSNNQKSAENNNENTTQISAQESDKNNQTDLNISKNDATFIQMVRQEAKELRLKEQLLSAPHLARVEDALRLNETKMANLEENLERTRKQQERVRRYQELTLEMREQKAHLFEINKQLAANAREKDELARFEEFENVQGQFQRLTLLETLRRQQQQHLSELTRIADTTRKELDDEQKRMQEQQDEMKDAQRRLSTSLDAICTAQQIEGRSSYLAIMERRCDERLNKLNSQATALQKETLEQERSLEELGEKIEKLSTRRQSIVHHQRMAMHGELVQERLKHLADLESELSKVEQLQKESERKESDENELLERVYSNYQQVEQDIHALRDELKVHRENNRGLDSYRLQERAMKLKLRRTMLIGAQSLWTRIAEGYTRIEDALQHINTLRLKKETLKDNIEKLSKEVAVLRRTCHEKEYTFTLSKSQNVIQLRSDLKEGTSCTVCGATHHPYHSDTMLEQNKLISELKTEFESMANELRAKEVQLHEMELEHATISASKEENENKLIMLRELQNAYTKDWTRYDSLDRTFEQCDSTVNAAARTAMLRQLVENIGSEVDIAQKELDTFNFHQNRINELSEQIANLERNKTDLITRLNEVNTGCQVMAGQVESVQNRKQQLNDNCAHVFSMLDKMITIPDWVTTWKRSHEALQMQIQELTQEWAELEAKLKDAESTRLLQESKLELQKQQRLALSLQIAEVENDKQECREHIDEDTEKLERLIGKTNSKKQLEDTLKDYQTTCENYKQQLENTQKCQLKLDATQGRLEELSETSRNTDERAAEERQDLDLWMRRYNANHPPVQYSELEETFGTDRSWNDLRVKLRSIEMDSLLTQARVDKLGSLLISLQAEGSLNNNDTDLIQHQLVSQIETYENRRRETMMQIAMLTQQLQAHKKAEETIKEERMKE